MEPLQDLGLSRLPSCCVAWHQDPDGHLHRFLEAPPAARLWPMTPIFGLTGRTALGTKTFLAAWSLFAPTAACSSALGCECRVAALQA